jgi:hypothetical protein
MRQVVITSWRKRSSQAGVRLLKHLEADRAKGGIDMTQEELTEFLSQNKDHFLEATRKAVMEKVTESVRWSLPSDVHETVSTFLKTEIAPEVAKFLAEQKGPILAAAKQAAVDLGNELAKKMTEQAVKSLDGYRAEEVFKALLGVKSRY